MDVEIRGLYPIHAAKDICGGTNSINKYIYIFVCFDTRDRPRSKVWWVPATSVPYTDIDSFFVPGPTSQPFAGWSEVSLVW